MTATQTKQEIREAVPLARLREVLSYNPDRGEFVWLKTLGSKAPTGTVAGSVGYYGYRTIRIDQRDYRAGRLAFFYMTTAWPENMVDHIDGDRANDRWSNLRQATPSQNCANAKRRSDQKHLKGVSPLKGRWSAKIRVRGKNKHIGYFATPEEAHAAYSTAAREAFGEFARIA